MYLKAGPVYWKGEAKDERGEHPVQYLKIIRGQVAK